MSGIVIMISPSEKKSYDVVIVGAGVQGLSSAVFLAKNGIKSVAVVEKEGFYGRGSSSRSGSMIMKSRENKPKIELSLSSFLFFQRFKEFFGEDLHFRRTGFLSLVGEGLAERYEIEHQTRRELGVPSEKLTTTDIGKLCPAISLEGVEFGVFCGDDGEVSAEQILGNYYKYAKKLGVDFFFDNEVEHFDTTCGKLTGLKSSQLQFECNYVVNAAGAGAPKVAALLAIDLPQSNLRRSIFFCRVEKPQLYAGPMVEDAELEWYYRGLVDGRVLIGMGLEPDSEITDGPNMDFLPEIRAATNLRAPALKSFEVIGGHSGIRPLSPDIVPIIGPSGKYPNFISNSGWGGEGIMHSPAGGAIVSDLIDGSQNYHFDIGAFNPKRFDN